MIFAIRLGIDSQLGYQFYVNNIAKIYPKFLRCSHFLITTLFAEVLH